MTFYQKLEVALEPFWRGYRSDPDGYTQITSFYNLKTFRPYGSSSDAELDALNDVLAYLPYIVERDESSFTVIHGKTHIGKLWITSSGVLNLLSMRNCPAGFLFLPAMHHALAKQYARLRVPETLSGFNRFAATLRDILRPYTEITSEKIADARRSLIPSHTGFSTSLVYKYKVAAPRRKIGYLDIINTYVLTFAQFYEYRARFPQAWEQLHRLHGTFVTDLIMGIQNRTKTAIVFSASVVYAGGSLIQELHILALMNRNTALKAYNHVHVSLGVKEDGTSYFKPAEIQNMKLATLNCLLLYLISIASPVQQVVVPSSLFPMLKQMGFSLNAMTDWTLDLTGKNVFAKLSSSLLYSDGWDG